jgi:hypothetical protein
MATNEATDRATLTAELADLEAKEAQLGVRTAVVKPAAPSRPTARRTSARGRAACGRSCTRPRQRSPEISR